MMQICKFKDYKRKNPMPNTNMIWITNDRIEYCKKVIKTEVE